MYGRGRVGGGWVVAIAIRECQYILTYLGPRLNVDVMTLLHYMLQMYYVSHKRFQNIGSVPPRLMELMKLQCLMAML